MSQTSKQKKKTTQKAINKIAELFFVFSFVLTKFQIKQWERIRAKYSKFGMAGLYKIQ